MSTLLHVSGVQNWYPELELRQEFSMFHKVVDDVYVTGRGYAYINMASAEDARKCRAALFGDQDKGLERIGHCWTGAALRR